MDCGQFHNRSAKGNDLYISDRMQIDPVATGSAGSAEVTQKIGQHDDCSLEGLQSELEGHDENEADSEMEIDQPKLNDSEQCFDSEQYFDSEYDDRAYSEDSCWKAQYLASEEAKCLGKVHCNDLVRPDHWHEDQQFFRESDECRRLDYYRKGNGLLVIGFDDVVFGDAYHNRDRDQILGAVLENFNTDGFKGILQSFLDSHAMIDRTPHSPLEEIRNLKIVNAIQKLNPRWLANKSVSVTQLVLKTGPFPLNSLETNALIASLALIAVEKGPKHQMMIFGILRIWNSRKYTETSLARRVDDETILLGMYRYYLGTAYQKHLHIFGAPIDIISFLQAIRPMYDINDSSYAQKLKDCNERTIPPKVVIERMAKVYVEFGNGDPGRLEKFISHGKTLWQRYLKTEYEPNHAQRGCKKAIGKLEENELDLFSSNLIFKDTIRIRDWQECDEIFDKDNCNDFLGRRCLMETEKPKLPESCRRELALLAPLGIEDPRRKIVFAAVKSIELFDGVSQLQEWDSKRGLEILAADEIRKELLAVELCDPVNALQVLHKLRLQHPALSFGNDIRAPAAPPAQEGSDNSKSNKKRAKNHGKDRNSTDLVEEEEAMNVASKKQRAEHAKSNQVKDTDRAETADQEATTAKKDDKIASMVISMLENVVKAKTSWPVVLSVVRHIFEGHDKFVDGMQMAKAKIIEKYHLTSKCDQELLEKQAGLDPCVDLGGIYREYLEVQLCSHKLVTVTLEEMTGHPVKCFKIADHLGFKTLQFHSDCIPVTEHYLSLSTGFIDGDENQSLVCFKLDSEFVDSVVADVLIKNGIAKRLGLLGKEDFRKYAPRNGKWASLDEGAVVALVQRELKPLFSRLCNLRSFKEAIFAVSTEGTECTGSLSAHGMRICFDKFVCSYEKARKVLKALEPFIKLCPVMHTKKLLAANGVIDLITGKLLGPALPEDCMIFSVPWDYDPDADLSGIQKYLWSFLPHSVYNDAEEMRTFFQRYLGSCLVYEKSEPFILIMTGRGKNGKSDLITLLVKTFSNEICGTLSAESISRPTGGNNDTLLRAKDCRFSVISELNNKIPLNDKLVKSLTGGDSVEMKGMWNASQVETVMMKVMLFANTKPEFQGKLDPERALQRRKVYWDLKVEFLGPNDTLQREDLVSAGKAHFIFPQSSNFQDVLDKCCPAFLTFIVKGAAQVLDNALCPGMVIPLPPTILATTEQVHSDDNDLNKEWDLLDFLRCHVENKHENFIATEEIYQVYLAMHKQAPSMLSKNQFSKLLCEALIPTKPSTCRELLQPTCSAHVRRKTEYGAKSSGFVGIEWKPDVKLLHVVGLRSKRLRGQEQETLLLPEATQPENTAMESVSAVTSVVDGNMPVEPQMDGSGLEKEQTMELELKKQVSVEQSIFPASIDLVGNMLKDQSILLDSKSGPDYLEKKSMKSVHLPHEVEGSVQGQTCPVPAGYMGRVQLSKEEAQNLVFQNLGSVFALVGDATHELCDADDGINFKFEGEAPCLLKIGDWSFPETQNLAKGITIYTIQVDEVTKKLGACNCEGNVCLHADKVDLDILKQVYYETG